jgi:hypothetical protein
MIEDRKVSFSWKVDNDYSIESRQPTFKITQCRYVQKDIDKVKNGRHVLIVFVVVFEKWLNMK